MLTQYLRTPAIFVGAVLRRQDVIHVEPDARTEEQKGCHYCASPLPSGIDVAWNDTQLRSISCLELSCSSAAASSTLVAGPVSSSAEHLHDGAYHISTVNINADLHHRSIPSWLRVWCARRHYLHLGLQVGLGNAQFPQACGKLVGIRPACKHHPAFFDMEHRVVPAICDHRFPALHKGACHVGDE